MCTCVAPSTRADEDAQCLACHDQCETCTTNGIMNYGNCSACKAGAIDISSDDDYKYCMITCPTGFTDPSCTMPSNGEKILHVNFNKPGTSYANSGSAGSAMNLSAVVDGSSGYPAYARGLHFNGSTNGYLRVPNLIKSHTFAVHAWVIAKSLTGPICLFSVDRDDFSKDAFE
jgi:hypothetical protein